MRDLNAKIKSVRTAAQEKESAWPQASVIATSGLSAKIVLLKNANQAATAPMDLATIQPASANATLVSEDLFVKRKNARITVQIMGNVRAAGNVSAT